MIQLLPLLLFVQQQQQQQQQPWLRSHRYNRERFQNQNQQQQQQQKHKRRRHNNSSHQKGSTITTLLYNVQQHHQFETTEIVGTKTKAINSVHYNHHHHHDVTSLTKIMVDDDHGLSNQFVRFDHSAYHTTVPFLTTGSSTTTTNMISMINDNEAAIIVGTNTYDDTLYGIGIALFIAYILAYLNGTSSSRNFISWWNQQTNHITSNDNNQNHQYNQNNNMIRNGMNKVNTNDNDDDTATSTVVSVTMNHTNTTTTTINRTNSTSFGEADWKEISRPENYILFSTRIKRKLQQQQKQKTRKFNINMNNNDNKGTTTTPTKRKNEMEENEQQEQQIINIQRKTNVWKDTPLLSLLLLFVPLFFIELFFALSRQFLCSSSSSTGSNIASSLFSIIHVPFTFFTPPPWTEQLCSAIITTTIILFQ